MKVTAIGTKVTLKLNDRKTQTEGGIALPMQHSKPEDEGLVISAGKEVRHVKEGDVVGFPSHLGTRFTSGPNEFLVIEESKLLYVRA
jgi:co-chaperonin GroES (HSP10)